VKLFGDGRIVAPTVLTARAAATRAPVFLYRLSRAAPADRSTLGGAAHGVEVPHVFDHTAGVAGYEAPDQAITAAMAGAWVQFAKTGTPNGPGLPDWPAYRAPDFRLLEYGDAIGVRSNADSPEVAFFERGLAEIRGAPAPKPAPTGTQPRIK
jgi:para-nitrobenzyl esterase